MKIETLTIKKLELKLKDPFSIAHGTSTSRQSVVVEIFSADHVGYGEAAVVPYYGESEESITRALRQMEGLLAKESVSDTNTLHLLLARLPSSNVAARGAVDIALWDLFGKMHDIEILDLFQTSRECPVSSLTIAMDPDFENYRRRLEGLKNWPHIKLKLGSGSLAQDLRFVEIAKNTVLGQLSVDANGGWSVEEAALAIPQIASARVLYIEQPVKPDPAKWRGLRQCLPECGIPIVADESFQQLSDLAALQGLADGVNIKLRKVGGLTAAYQCLEAARIRGMKSVLGCMIESSVAVSAAAQLASLADFVDLDAPLLIANDPFSGVRIESGKLHFPDRPGHGAIPC